MPDNWRIYGDETIAAVLDKSELPGFWHRVVVGPNECALIIRDGKIQETVTQERVRASGFISRMAGLFGRAEDLQVVFVATTPFDLSFYLGDYLREESETGSLTSGSLASGSVDTRKMLETRHDVYTALEAQSHSDTTTSRIVIKALSIDSQPITAQIGITLSVDIDDAVLLNGFLRNKSALATWDIGNYIRDELIAKILVPEIARYRADELRGNKELSNIINQAVGTDLKTTFNLWGLTLENFFINWGLTEQEEQEIQLSRETRQDQATDFYHSRGLRDMERELDINRTKISNLNQLTRLEAQGEDELKEIYLAAQLNRENMLDGQRINIAEITSQIRLIELNIEQQESNLKLENQRKEAEVRLEVERKEAHTRQEELEAQSRLQLGELEKISNLQSQRQNEQYLRELETRRESQRADFERRKLELEHEYSMRQIRQSETRDRGERRERLISQDMNPDVLKTMLEQETDQVYADSSDEAIRSRSQAQGQSNNIDSIRQEQDRERNHQADMTRLAADMMEASKQVPGIPTSIPQQPPLSSGPTVNLTSFDGYKANSSPNPSDTGLSCQSCSASLDPDWKNCPYCGVSPNRDQLCSGCGKTMKSEWIMCPNCSTPVTNASNCPSCKHEIGVNWKSCAFCGAQLNGSSG